MANAIPVSKKKTDETAVTDDQGQAQFAQDDNKAVGLEMAPENPVSIVDYRVEGGVSLETHEAVREDH